MPGGPYEGVEGKARGRADLHVHTDASDGFYPPEQVVARAAEIGLAAVAITDHDTVAAVAPAMEAARRLPGPDRLTVVPGVELSTAWPGAEVHILGYGIDPHHQPLLKTLDEFRQTRLERAEAILARLRRLDMPLPPSSVQDRASGQSIGRPHIARAMMAAGYVNSVGQAFDYYLGRGRPAYVPSPKPSAEEGVKIITDAGGAAVLAHPGLLPADPVESGLLKALIDAGLQGIEVYHSKHTPAMEKRFADMARRHGLIATGGSDCHGPGPGGRGEQMGTVTVPVETVSRLGDASRKSLP